MVVLNWRRNQCWVIGCRHVNNKLFGCYSSNNRLLQGTGSSATFQGPVNINVTNSAAGTVIQMGENGTTTYNGNINVVNSGGASGVTFNGQTLLVQSLTE